MRRAEVTVLKERKKKKNENENESKVTLMFFLGKKEIFSLSYSRVYIGDYPLVL